MNFRSTDTYIFFVCSDSFVSRRIKSPNNLPWKIELHATQKSINNRRIYSITRLGLLFQYEFHTGIYFFAFQNRFNIFVQLNSLLQRDIFVGEVFFLSQFE